MKIVYICDFFHPYAGYHPNLLSKFWARFGHEVYMLCSEMEKIPAELTEFFGADDIEAKDRKFEADTGVKIIRLPLIRFFSGRSVYTGEIFRTIKRIAPDVVFVNGNDTLIGIQLTLRYRRLGCGLVMDSHMLEMASENRFSKLFRTFYRRFVTPAVIKNDIPVIRTQNDPYVEKCLGIPLERCPWISFGTDMTIFHPDPSQKKSFREEHGIEKDAFVVLYAGKLIESKGLGLLASAAEKRFETKRKIVFLIIGNTEGSFGEDLERRFSESENRVLRFPTQRYADLPEFYQAADAAVFPKQCSLSFFDTQACGLPVIFEDNNINIGRATDHNAITFKQDDADALRAAIEHMAGLTEAELGEYSANAVGLVKRTYDYEVKAREYIPYLEAQSAAAKGAHR